MGELTNDNDGKRIVPGEDASTQLERDIESLEKAVEADTHPDVEDELRENVDGSVERARDEGAS